MVVDSSNTLYVGMEYFCNEDDDLWGMADSELSKLAVDELVKMGFATNGDILATNVIRMKKAYPAYHGSYCSIDAVRSFLDGISNLYCIGRNGQHRYNNMDHSMLTAIKAVDAMQGLCEKSLIWNVNTEHTYNEEVD
jgi:protoporphyrinogen oxidase